MGGYAMKEAGVVPVPVSKIPTLISKISELSGIAESDLVPLGSTGKVPISSDVDLAVDATKYSADKIHSTLTDQLPTPPTFNVGTGVGSYAVGLDSSSDHYQVDIMFTTNLAWATFAYNSPGDASSYKGAVRTLLLMGVAATHSDPQVDYFEYENGELTIRAGRTFDLNNGLRRILQYRPRSKMGDRYLKTMKTVNKEAFVELFPRLDEYSNEVLINDPKSALEVLFNATVTPEQVNTAEQVIELIKTSFDNKRQEQIFRKAAERAQSVRNKMDLPEEIKQYM